MSWRNRPLRITCSVDSDGDLVWVVSGKWCFIWWSVYVCDSKKEALAAIKSLRQVEVFE